MQRLSFLAGAVAIVLLPVVPASADYFCGDGLMLGPPPSVFRPDGTRNCVPAAKRPSSARESLDTIPDLITRMLSTLAPTDDLGPAASDLHGAGTSSRDYNRAAFAALRGRASDKLRVAMLFAMAADYARKAGNEREYRINRYNQHIALAALAYAGAFNHQRAGNTRAALADMASAQKYVREMPPPPDAIAYAAPKEPPIGAPGGPGTRAPVDHSTITGRDSGGGPADELGGIAIDVAPQGETTDLGDLGTRILQMDH